MMTPVQVERIEYLSGLALDVREFKSLGDSPLNSEGALSVPGWIHSNVFPGLQTQGALTAEHSTPFLDWMIRSARSEHGRDNVHLLLELTTDPRYMHGCREPAATPGIVPQLVVVEGNKWLDAYQVGHSKPSAAKQAFFEPGGSGVRSPKGGLPASPKIDYASGFPRLEDRFTHELQTGSSVVLVGLGHERRMRGSGEPGAPPLKEARAADPVPHPATALYIFGK